MSYSFPNAPVISYGAGAITLPSVLADGANVSVNAASRDYFELTMGALGTRQLDNPTGLAAGQRRVLVFRLTHGGTEAITFDTLYRFGDPGAPSYPAGGTIDIVTAIWDGTNLLCSYVQGY